MSGFLSEPERSHEEPVGTTKSIPNGSDDFNDQPQKARPGRGSSLRPYEENEKETEMEITAGQKMLSATSGSLLTSLLVTPLDVVRVRLQSQPSIPKFRNVASSNPASKFVNIPQNLGITSCCREVFWVNNNSQFCMAGPTSTSISTNFTAINHSLPSTGAEPAANCAADASRQKTFTSTLDGLQKIARNEGFTSLWRGLSPTLVMSIPGNVIYFTGYDWLRSNPHSIIQQTIPDYYAPLVAGSVARVAAATVISPIEMFRTRMQAATGGDSGIFIQTLSGLRTLVRAEGYRSLWRGLSLTMWRDVPFSGIYWWGYETVRNQVTTWRESTQVHYGRPRSDSGDHSNTFIDSFIAGATSGAFASIVTTPFDVGKTRRQVLERSNCEAGKPILRPEERSMPRFLLAVWKEEGIGGLFKGWTARCLKVAPACAIMISSYEVGKRMARRMNERKRDLAAIG